MNVLILDESAIIRKIIQTNLLNIETVSITTHEALDGDSAFRLLRTSAEKIELIIADNGSSKMTGAKFFHKLAEEYKNSMPKVIVTGNGISAATQTELFGLGIDTILPKPFNKYSFMGVVEPIINDIVAGVKKGHSLVGGGELLGILSGELADLRIEDELFVLEFDEKQIEIPLESLLKIAKIKNVSKYIDKSIEEKETSSAPALEPAEKAS